MTDIKYKLDEHSLKTAEKLTKEELNKAIIEYNKMFSENPFSYREEDPIDPKWLFAFVVGMVVFFSIGVAVGISI